MAPSRKDHPNHEVAAAWVKSAVIAKQLVLLPIVATGFVRIVTNAPIFPTPTPTEVALAFVNTILDATETQQLSLGSELLQFCALVESTVLTANAIPDAWIAAAAREHNQRLVTFDKGFRKLLPRSQVTVLTL